MSKNNEQISSDIRPKPPVAVILGHVDHGKTSILDYIRKSKIAEKESGGITQHIGAYQIEHQGKLITFIDTPGHEAFSAMRSRGAKVADIAILVVAADDGVKPQTKEAIKIIQHLNLPIIVALNKMDRPGVLPDKVKKELADNGLIVESIGGKIPSIFTSAKSGLGIEELLEMIILIAEMENLSGDYSKPAEGIIIESRLTPQRGAIATLLVRDGVLNEKSIIAAESAYGQIKTMEDFLGKPLEQAGPSTPVLVSGFNNVPPVGEEWQIMPSIETAQTRTKIKADQEKKKRQPTEILEIDANKKVFNIVLNADFSGSLEAIREIIKTIPQDEIALRVIKAEVGDITENDIKFAESANARIYGFRVKAQPAAEKIAENIAERRNIKIISSWQIIYELIQAIRHDASYLLTPEINHKKQGRLKILEVFKIDGKKQIIGGKVTTGKIERGLMADIYRHDENIGSGRISQLQHNKQNTAEVIKDRECGLMFESEIKVEKSDILEAYKETKEKKEL